MVRTKGLCVRLCDCQDKTSIQGKGPGEDTSIFLHVQASDDGKGSLCNMRLAPVQLSTTLQHKNLIVVVLSPNSPRT